MGALADPEFADLFGRDREREVLRGAVAGTDGPAVLLIGEPGIGKTALLDAAAAQARRTGCAVLRATGIESEQSMPYAGVHQLFRPLFAHAAELAGPQRDALGVALGRHRGPAPEPFLVALACLGLADRASADRRLVIVVDDVPWLDDPSSTVLTFLARRLDDGTALLGAARAGYHGPLVGAMRVVELDGLDRDAAALLVQRVAPDTDPATRNRILGLARGNPLALVELPGLASDLAVSFSGAADGSMSRSLESAFAGWVAGLAEGVREFLTVAACYSGDDVDTVVAATGRLTGREVPAAVLDAAVEARVVDIAGPTFRFRHPLIRSAVVGAQPPGRRLATHAALAAALDRDPSMRAWHRANASVAVDAGVADELAAAAETMLARGSPGHSVAFLHRAAQLTVDPAEAGRRYLTAAERAVGVGGTDRVADLAGRARRRPLSTIDRIRLDLLHEVLTEGEPGDAQRVRRLCARARDAAAGAPGLTLDLLLAAAQHTWWCDPGSDVRREVVDTVRRFAGDARRDPRYVAAVAVAEPVESAAAVLALLSGFDPAGVEDADALRLLGLAAFAVGDTPRARDYLDRAETRLRATGRIGVLIQVLMTQVGGRVYTGDVHAAASAVEEATAFGPDVGRGVWDNGMVVARAHVAALRGDLTHALATIRRAEIAAGTKRQNVLLTAVQLVKGTAWAASGGFTEAYVELRRLFDPADPAHHVRQSYPGVMFLAEAARYSRPDDLADARSVVDGFARLAATTPAPDLHVHLAYARAVLADDAEAEDLFAAALATNLQRWPLVRAMTELAYGSWLRRHRRIVESRRPTRSALATFEQLGTGGWAARARAGLASAGERPRIATAPVQDLLTPQQYQIARLAADGLSNREIGQRLFLSPRTVGSHLYRIFPRIAVTSRIQLVERLRQDG